MRPDVFDANATQRPTPQKISYVVRHITLRNTTGRLAWRRRSRLRLRISATLPWALRILRSQSVSIPKQRAYTNSFGSRVPIIKEGGKRILNSAKKAACHPRQRPETGPLGAKRPARNHRGDGRAQAPRRRHGRGHARWGRQKTVIPPPGSVSKRAFGRTGAFPRLFAARSSPDYQTNLPSALFPMKLPKFPTPYPGCRCPTKPAESPRLIYLTNTAVSCPLKPLIARAHEPFHRALEKYFADGKRLSPSRDGARETPVL